MVNCSADLSGVYSLWETLSPWVTLYLTIGFGVFSFQSIRLMIKAFDDRYSLKCCRTMTLPVMLTVVMLWWIIVVYVVKGMVTKWMN